MPASHVSSKVKSLLKAGQRQQALALLSQALRSDAGYIEGWWLLSFAIEDRPKQVYALQRVLQLSPNNPKVLERLARLDPGRAQTLAPALSKQLPASSAVTSTREGRTWAAAIGGGLLLTLLVAAALTLALRTSPAQASQAEEPLPLAALPVTATHPPATEASEPLLAQTDPTIEPTTLPTLAPTAEPTVEVQPDEPAQDTATVTLLTDSNIEALELPVFDRFVQTIANGDASQRVGVFVENQFQYPVVPQPASDPAWVTSTFGEVTEFRIVRQHTGNEGLIAHNYLAGGSFYGLRAGDIAKLVLGDGSVMEFEIYEIHDYQALTPNSATSDFLNLQTGEKVSASELFYRMYGGQMTLTFQTCINRDNISTWGRTFIIGAEL